MDENYNTDPEIAKDIKTSSTDSKDNSKTTGDSQVQDGSGVEGNSVKSYDKSDEQQEYLQSANNNTKIANENVAETGKNN